MKLLGFQGGLTWRWCLRMIFSSTTQWASGVLSTAAAPFVKIAEMTGRGWRKGPDGRLPGSTAPVTQGTGRRPVVFALRKPQHTPPPGLEGRSFIVPGPRARARRPAPSFGFGCGVADTVVVSAKASPRPSPVSRCRGSMPDGRRPGAHPAVTG